jgi:hypothetical protein
MHTPSFEPLTTMRFLENHQPFVAPDSFDSMLVTCPPGSCNSIVMRGPLQPNPDTVPCDYELVDIVLRKFL